MGNYKTLLHKFKTEEKKIIDSLKQKKQCTVKFITKLEEKCMTPVQRTGWWQMEITRLLLVI